jgi:hypothetical protein
VRSSCLLVTLIACGLGVHFSGSVKDSTSPGARARVYLLEAQKSAAQVRQDFTRNQLLDKIATGLAKTGDFEGALQIVQGIYPSGFEAVKEIGTGMVAAGKVAEAKAMAKRLPGGEGSSLLAFVAEAEAQSGDVEAAIATANAIDAPEVKREAMRNVAAAQVKAGNLAAARETFRNWPEPEPGPAETPALLADRVTAAIAEALVPKDFQAALKMASGIHNPQEEVGTYFGIVFGLIDAGDIAHAKVALSQLREVAGPHRVSYPISYMLAKVGLMSEALETARAIQGADPESQGAQAKALTTIAILQAEQGNSHTALKTVAEIGTHQRKPGPMTEFLRHEALLSVARAQTNAGDPHGAIETVKGVPLTTPADAVLKHAVLFERAYAWAKAGEFSQALAVAKQMHKGGDLVPGERADAMRTLAAIQAHKGEAENTAQWAAALSDAIDRAAAFLGIAEGLEGKSGLETQEFFVH